MKLKLKLILTKLLEIILTFINFIGVIMLVILVTIVTYSVLFLAWVWEMMTTANINPTKSN